MRKTVEKALFREKQISNDTKSRFIAHQPLTVYGRAAQDEGLRGSVERIIVMNTSGDIMEESFLMGPFKRLAAKDEYDGSSKDNWSWYELFTCRHVLLCITRGSFIKITWFPEGRY